MSSHSTLLSNEFSLDARSWISLTTRIEKLEIQLRPASSKNKKTLTAESEKKSISNPLEFDVVSTKRYGEEMLGVKVKITNISNRHINSCDATCILQDAQGKKLTFQRHYVIKSIDGGLPPGASTYFEYVIDVRPELVKGVSFHIETLDWWVLWFFDLSFPARPRCGDV